MLVLVPNLKVSHSSTVRLNKFSWRFDGPWNFLNINLSVSDVCAKLHNTFYPIRLWSIQLRAFDISLVFILRIRPKMDVLLAIMSQISNRVKSKKKQTFNGQTPTFSKQCDPTRLQQNRVYKKSLNNPTPSNRQIFKETNITTTKSLRNPSSHSTTA